MANKSSGKTRRVRVGSSFQKVTSTLFGCNVNHLGEHYTKIANSYLATNGPKWTCSRLKAYYDLSCRLTLQLKVENIDFCRTDRDGVPKDLAPFKPFLVSDVMSERRAALTLLRAFVQIYTEASKDTESITKLGSAETAFEPYEPYFKEVTKKYLNMLKPYIVDEGLYTTSKKGPNGPALLDVDKDYVAIHREKLVKTIMSFHKEMEKLSTKTKSREVALHDAFAPDFDCPPFDEDYVDRSPRFKRKIRMMKCVAETARFAMKHHPERYNGVVTGRLGFLPEGGCKTRVIAMGDYFTQDALKPLHKSLYRCLNKLQTDGTSSHNRLSMAVQERTLKCSHISSFDLTAATDRFPIFIQSKILSWLYNPKVGSLWKQLMVKRSFTAESNVQIRYSVGQPMGLLSSWATFAISHHITVEALALKLGKPGFKDYCIIGDDVTIFDKKVAQEYKKFLDVIQVDISKAKSLVSDESPYAAEIAKRIFLNGVELSPIPYDAIESAIKDFRLFPNLLKLCQERGVLSETHPVPVQSMLETIYPKGKKAFNTLVLITFPGSRLPHGITETPWSVHSHDQIIECFNAIKIDYIKTRAKGLYENELANIPDLGILGLALESEEAPDITAHPLMSLLRAYRDRCGSLYQGILIKGLESSELDLIPFLINPMIPQYMRRTHQIEKVRSSLILKAFGELQTNQAV